MTSMLFVASALVQAPSAVAPLTSPMAVILDLEMMSTTGLLLKEEQVLRARIAQALAQEGVGVRWLQVDRTTTATVRDTTPAKIEVVRLASVVTWSVTMLDLDTCTEKTKNWTDTTASLKSPENLVRMLLPLAEQLRRNAERCKVELAQVPAAPLIAADITPTTPPAVGKTPVDDPPSRPGVGVAPIVAWGLSAVGLTVAAVFGIRAYTLRRDNPGDTVSRSIHDSMVRTQQIEAVGLGVGGAAAIAGTAMWYFEWP